MFLEILPKIVAFMAIAWSIRQILNMRNSVLSGRVMIPASLAHILLFIVFELIVFIGGFSPLHLLWLWPFSVVLGLVLLFVPFTVVVLMFFTALLRLTGKPKYEDDEEFFLESDDIYLDDEEHVEGGIIDVDFQSHSHSRGKSEKRRKKKGKKRH